MHASIVLMRVDNRLVHGQVGVTWTNFLNVDTIVVVDDEVAVSILPQKLMQTIANTASVKIRFYSISGFIHAMHAKQSRQKLFIVVKTIQTARILVENDIGVEKINIGNIHYEKGRVPLNKKVYLNEKDIEDLNYINSRNCFVYYQDVPGTAIEKIDKLDHASLARR